MKTVQIGKCKVACFSLAETKRIPNRPLGRNGRISVPEILQEDKRLSQYINNETMGALDNYAKHENLNLYISPLENDLFDDLSVSVYNGYDSSRQISTQFPMKISEGKNSFHDFMRDLYTRVGNIVNDSKSKEIDKTLDILS